MRHPSDPTYTRTILSLQERKEKEALLWESKREWEGKVAHFAREKETLETSKIVSSMQRPLEVLLIQ